MTHGSLFSGIGGFDLAAEWMGWQNKFHCEWNEFGQSILKYYWPDAKTYGDIDKADFTIWRGLIDVLSGGFPCQPYSQAGQRKGSEDVRHKWPQMLRAIREIQPDYVVGENVSGLTNWNGGLVFDQVQANLEAEGYEVLPFLLPACGVGAPHKRERIWFIAHSRSVGTGTGTSGRNESWKLFQESERIKNKQFDQFIGEGGTTADTDGGVGCKRGLYEAGQEKTERYAGPFDSWNSRDNWQNFPTQPPVCSGNDGLPRELDGITFSKWRNESIKGYGNAIVPQVAFEIFKVIGVMKHKEY